MAREQTTDERLIGLLDDVTVFNTALETEVARDMERAEPFIEQGQRRFVGRQGVCLTHLCGYIEAVGRQLGPETLLRARLLRMSLASSGPLASKTATALLALGYALALADLAAGPPDGEASTGS